MYRFVRMDYFLEIRHVLSKTYTLAIRTKGREECEMFQR